MSDGSAVVFNLTIRQHFPVKDHSKAIKCRDDLGPCFGGYYADLGTVEPFNGNEKCWSHTNKAAYDIPSSKGMNMLTNTNTNDGELGIGSNFIISDLEVWEVKFLE